MDYPFFFNQLKVFSCVKKLSDILSRTMNTKTLCLLIQKSYCMDPNQEIRNGFALSSFFKTKETLW